MSLSSVPYEEPKQNNWKYRKPTSYHNNFYPLGDFRAGKEYTTHPVRITNCSMDEQPPDNRYVRGSGQAFPNLALVCRQMHAEVGVLPYLGNAFSFDSPYTMFHLLSSMLPVQRAALRVLWVDMEWRGALWGPHTDFAGLRLWGLDDNVQFVVSKVAVRGALERWHEKSGFRPEVLDLQLWYEEDRFWLWLAKNFLGPSASYGYLRLLDYVD